MDKEPVVKVIRLRIRKSIDQSDDGKSSAPTTPVKKRGRTAMKPELELINENETNTTKPTKKTIKQEVTDNVEEKPVTPARRSARIKSNTSIVSDTALYLDSPRSKRATRRNSQAGSDAEMPVTPARITRRTRKDSTSSVEKEPASVVIKTSSQISEIITEEPENSTKQSNDGKTSDGESNKENSIRRSPRLSLKKLNNHSVVSENDINCNNNGAGTNIQADNNQSTDPSDTILDDKNVKSDSADNEKTTKKGRLSISSANLIMNLETRPKHMFTHNNKSLTEAKELNKVESKRRRTKSWTILTSIDLTNDESDDEKDQEKLIESVKNISKKKISDIGFGDSELKDSDDNNKTENIDISQNDLNKSKFIEIGQDKKDMSTIYSSHSGSESENKSDDKTTDSLEKNSSGNFHTIVEIEDSGPNSAQINIENKNDNEDQCVPVVNNVLGGKDYDDLPHPHLQQSFEFKNNDSLKLKDQIANDTCEPMDVDETLPAKLIDNLPEETQLDNSQNPTSNISKSSKRKSINISSSQMLKKSGNENKSTTTLSQLKDLSSSENKSEVLSNNKPLSNSINVLNVTQENMAVNNKQPSNYLTSTPLQEKSDGEESNKKYNLFSSNKLKHQDKLTVKKKILGSTNEPKYSSKNITSDEDSSSEKEHELLANEAEEASDNYESGDSQDEEEKEYEKDHEIVEKGETLTSEDELSNDSDYEKDSFVVSSNEDDNELLSGSGDDLTMSDNELKMSSSSKKKYNERKLKQQKQASREMFESRHHSNNSSRANKSKLKLSSNQGLESSESDEDIKRPKNKNRMRLNSSTNENITEPEREMEVEANKGKEKEMTICEEVDQNPIVTSKVLQKTPEKESECSAGSVDTELINDIAVSETATNRRLSKKNKTGNNTLNFETTPEKRDEHSIVDKFNRTEVKEKSKKEKNDNLNKTKEDKTKKEDDDYSDSIDLNLLFSEESSNSEHSNKEMKENIESIENVIPLKTNTPLIEDDESTKQDALPFFVDTEGNHCDKNYIKSSYISSSDDSDTDESPNECLIKKNNDSIEKEDQKTFDIKNKKTTRTSIALNISEVENTNNKSANKTYDGEIQDNKEKSLNMSKDKENITKVMDSNKIHSENIEAKETIKHSAKKKSKSENDVASFRKSINESLKEEKLASKGKRKHSKSSSIEFDDKTIHKKPKESKNTEDLVIPSKENSKRKANKSLKRKNRDDDDGPNNAVKVLKQDSLDQVHIPRQPAWMLKDLEDKRNKPKGKIPVKTSNVLATTEFVIEKTNKRCNKPSNYLEESIIMYNDHEEEVKKPKSLIQNPKVLPSLPSAMTSHSGFTTNFKVKVLPQTIKFVAQSTNVANFKNEHLYGKKIKRLGTYDLYKKNRNIKMSKF